MQNYELKIKINAKSCQIIKLFLIKNLQSTHTITKQTKKKKILMPHFKNKTFLEMIWH